MSLLELKYHNLIPVFSISPGRWMRMEIYKKMAFAPRKELFGTISCYRTILLIIDVVFLLKKGPLLLLISLKSLIKKDIKRNLYATATSALIWMSRFLQKKTNLLREPQEHSLSKDKEVFSMETCSLMDSFISIHCKCFKNTNIAILKCQKS